MGGMLCIEGLTNAGIQISKDSRVLVKFLSNEWVARRPHMKSSPATGGSQVKSAVHSLIAATN